jgi:hypothetical protein
MVTPNFCELFCSFPTLQFRRILFLEHVANCLNLFSPVWALHYSPDVSYHVIDTLRNISRRSQPRWVCFGGWAISTVSIRVCIAGGVAQRVVAHSAAGGAVVPAVQIFCRLVFVSNALPV